MLLFKSDESVARAITHYVKTVEKFTQDSFADTVEMLAEDSRESVREKLEPVLEEPLSHLRQSLRALSHQTRQGEYAEPELLPIRVGEYYNTFLREISVALVQQAGEDHQARTVALALSKRLQLFNASEFIADSRNSQHQRLIDLVEKKTLAVWRTVFYEDTFLEKSLLVALGETIEKDLSASTIAQELKTGSEDDVAEDLAQFYLKIYFDETIEPLMRSLATSKLENNSSLDELFSTIDEVRENYVKRMASRTFKMVCARMENVDDEVQQISRELF